MTGLAVILGLLFAALCLVFVSWHGQRRGRLTLLDWALLAMAGFYGCAWALVALVTSQGGNPAWSSWLLPAEYLYPLHTLCSLALAVSMLFGWGLLAPRLPLSERKGDLEPQREVEKFLLFAMWLMLGIAFLAQWFYSQAYGGFLGVLEYSQFIRAFVLDRLPSNSFTYLKPLVGLAPLCSFGLLGLWMYRRKSLSIVIGLLLSILFSVYLLYSWAGRVGFLVYLMTFVLGIAIYKRAHPRTMLVAGCLGMLMVVPGAYALTALTEWRSADSFASFLILEISFPFGSFFARLESGENLYRGFIDLLMLPMYFLPTSWWSPYVETAGQLNTALIRGAAKGAQGVTGAVPVDLLTLGIMQASVLGVVVVGFLFGSLLRFLQHLLDRLPHPGVRAFLEASVVLNIAVLGVFYGQPNMLIKENFALICVGAFLGISFRAFGWRRFSKPQGLLRRNVFGDRGVLAFSLRRGRSQQS